MEEKKTSIALILAILCMALTFFYNEAARHSQEYSEENIIPVYNPKEFPVALPKGCDEDREYELLKETYEMIMNNSNLNTQT